MTQPLSIPGYRPIRKIEKGGMTDLFVAWNRNHERVVLRSIRETAAKNRKIRKAFKHGASILEKLDHPNIVKLVDRGSHRGKPFVAVAYHECHNLRECILRRESVIQHYPIQIIRELATGLEYLHRQGYLHMDLKPENLLVRQDRRCIYIDFDLSIEHHSRTVKLKDVPGTATYLAPEVLRHKMVEEASEIYSFGVVIFELLTLHKPYPATTPNEYQREVIDLDKPALPVRTYREDISLGLEKVILKCLAKRVEDRYPSMSLVRRDIEALI